MPLCSSCRSITLKSLAKNKGKVAGSAHVLLDRDLVRSAETCQLCSLLLTSVRNEEQKRGVELIPFCGPYTLAIRAKHDPPSLVFPSLENQDGLCLTGFTISIQESEDVASGTIRLFTSAGK
jgi:hypothetical protein